MQSLRNWYNPCSVIKGYETVGYSLAAVPPRISYMTNRGPYILYNQNLTRGMGFGPLCLLHAAGMVVTELKRYLIT